MSGAALAWPLSWWRQRGGELPDDALRIIDAHVRETVRRLAKPWLGVTEL